MSSALSPEQFKSRIGFVLELARHLHESGTTVNRLEGAVERVSRKLGLEVGVWSSPTGIIISFDDQLNGDPFTITRVLRLHPGDTNLGRMADADAIAEQVMDGRLGIAEGLARLREIDRQPSYAYRAVQAGCFGVASAMVVSLFPGTGWNDLLAAASLGMLIGVLTQLGARRQQLFDAVEAVAAFLVTFAASYLASHVAPLSVNAVTISALIILMPGLMLTTAINELANQQLASGSARFAGAVTVLLKLTFGTILAAQLVDLLAWQSLPNGGAPALPPWMPMAMLVPGALALAVLFKAHLRDIPIAMLSVFLGFGVMKACSLYPGLSGGDIPIGTFLAAFAVTSAANLYARLFNRPGALIRVPGIILLVPGSLGFQILNTAMTAGTAQRVGIAIPLFAALIALVAGILFGNLLVSSRRNL
jgi:uncharacterized membrane protein YjjP (DUF1212 family)